MERPQRSATCSSSRRSLFLIVFNIFPLIYSLGYSFTDFRASTNAPANFVGLQNYRELLNDAYIWNNFVDHRQIRDRLGRRPGAGRLRHRPAAQPRHSAQGPDHHAAAAADDDVDGGGRPVLEAALRPVLGHHQLRARPRRFRLAVRPRRGALRGRASPTSGCGRPSSCCCRSPACRPCRSTSTRRRRSTAPARWYTFTPHHAAAGGAAPADRAHLPHHGGVQDLRPRLHHEQPADAPS